MQYPLEPYAQIPSSLVSLLDYEPVARRQLGEASWAYFASGGADEITLRRNRSAYDQKAILPRVLTELSGLSTEVQVAGQRYPHPIFLAPVAYQRLAHREGEFATLAAAGAMKAPMIVSTQATARLEDLAQRAESPLWFQLYFQAERAQTLGLVQRAERAHYAALVITVDAPVNGLRNAMQRAQFQVPTSFQGFNVPPDSTPQRLEDLLSRAPTWSDIEWILEQTTLPVWLKGILHPEDAKLAQQLGCAGVIVSNHGGRVLDTLPSTLEMLPEIRQAVGSTFPLLMDGGIRRGTDILKALALGANAVLIGRPYIYGLSVAGALGVAHVIHLLKTELEIAMALAGINGLQAPSPTLRDAS